LNAEMLAVSVFDVPLGKGIINVKAVLDIIKNSSSDPNILIEQWMEKATKRGNHRGRRNMDKRKHQTPRFCFPVHLASGIRSMIPIALIGISNKPPIDDKKYLCEIYAQISYLV